MNTLGSLMLASAAPQRLHDWYTTVLPPAEVTTVGDYQILRYGAFFLFLDRRDDVGSHNLEPGRFLLNFDVEDARAVADRIEASGATWVSPLEDRDGSLFATAADPDGNYVQVIQLSEAHRAEMAESAPADQPASV